MPTDQRGEDDYDVQEALDALDDALSRTVLVTDQALDEAVERMDDMQIRIAKVLQRRRARKDTPDAPVE